MVRRRRAAGAFPRASLFAGPPFAGKLSTALEAARVLTCAADGAWGCECTACRQQRELVHPHTVMLGWRYADVEIPASARLLVKDGTKVAAGEQLTEGSLNPHRILRILGREAGELYLLTEVQKVYRSQGQNINDKHFEVIIRKMLSKVQITQPGDTDMLPGDLMDRLYLQGMNERLLADGKQPGRGAQILLGVTKASLNTESFLSASSFQHTIKVLAGAAIEGKVDYLRGLKENVIIGKLIPAGTGFPGEEAVLHDERLEPVAVAAAEEPLAEPEQAPE